MADQNREVLEITIGVTMAQSALCDFLVKSGAIKIDPLIEHLAARRVAWEKTATSNALFAVDMLLSLLAGRKPPPFPSSLHEIRRENLFAGLLQRA
jgi:hypothetical protein